MNSNDLVFALDIGTRTVIGVVGSYQNSKFKVNAIDIVEHKNRAMIDGQVHNIEEVAEAVRKVKRNLEKKLGVVLENVSIAAAGRSLRTRQIKVERNIDSRKEIDANIVGSLEMEGILAAQSEFEEEMRDSEDVLYYCVGYTVVNYYLNNYIISSLIGHKGKSIGADVLATFLPHTVVDSLYAVTNRAGLKVTNLTLEPIAAISVAIPKNIRLLNLALVDIGAGTSDIAITQGGSVVAYAMVPVAGDEITEIICQNYLLDFNVAERTKMNLNKLDIKEITFVDILGIEHTVKAEDIRELIKPAVKKLADTIAEKITEYNKKSPSAVFLVGGGSQVLDLPEMVAENLSIAKERVAVKKIDSVENVQMKGKKQAGPEYVTPLGIALNSLQKEGSDFMYVTVNGKKIKLFNVRQQTVADALLLAGIKPEELIPKKGKALSFKLNGEKKVVNGGFGQAAEIYINTELSNIQSLLKPGDVIYVKSALPGELAEISVGDIAEYYVGQEVEVVINNVKVNYDYLIKQEDEVEVLLSGSAAIPEKSLEEVLNEEVEELQELDRLEAGNSKMRIEESGTVNRAENREEIIEEKKELSIHENSEEKTNNIWVIVNSKPVNISGKQSEFIFIDVFNHIDLDPKDKNGKVKMKLNGKFASFTDIIKDKDIIDIYWD